MEQHMRKQLSAVRKQLKAGSMQALHGVIRYLLQIRRLRRAYSASSIENTCRQLYTAQSSAVITSWIMAAQELGRP